MTITVVHTVPEPKAVRDHHHVIYRREVLCGHPGCDDVAHRWGRCAGCKKLVARCGAHEHRFGDTLKGHCQ